MPCVFGLETMHELSNNNLHDNQNISPLTNNSTSIDEEYLYNLNYLLKVKQQVIPNATINLNSDPAVRSFKYSPPNNSKQESAKTVPCKDSRRRVSAVTIDLHKPVVAARVKEFQNTICTVKNTNAPNTIILPDACIISSVNANRSSTFSTKRDLLNVSSPKSATKFSNNIQRGLSFKPGNNVDSPPSFSSSTDEMQSGQEFCFQCEKRVYPLDRLSTGDRVYHKPCFRCKECNRTLSATNFAKLDGIIFCKPHYIEKFRLRGKYEAVQKVAPEKVAPPPTSE